jgi:multimeric flavodoxin WrbA
MQFTFLNASVRDPAQCPGNTETLARAAASTLPPQVSQHWLRLADMQLAPFVDQRHSVGEYPAPTGDLATLAQATLAATDLVFVSPVYWYSLPAPLKLYLDHWSAWMRVPAMDFKARMAAKTLWLITTSGDRAKAQPMIDSVQLCAQFLSMRWGGVLWAKGGAPGAVAGDAAALAAAAQWWHAQGGI